MIPNIRNTTKPNTASNISPSTRNSDAEAQVISDEIDAFKEVPHHQLVIALKHAWNCTRDDKLLPKDSFRFIVDQEDASLLPAASRGWMGNALQELTRPSKSSMAQVNGKMYIKVLTLVLQEQSPVSVHRHIVNDREQPHYDKLSDPEGQWSAPVVFITASVRIIVFLTDSGARGCPGPLQKSERLAVLRMLRSYEERYARMNLGRREYSILSVQYGFARWVQFERRGLEIVVRLSQWFNMSDESHLAAVHHLVTRDHAHGPNDATRWQTERGRGR